MKIFPKALSRDQILQKIRSMRLGVEDLNRAINRLDLSEDDKECLARIAKGALNELRQLSTIHADILSQADESKPKPLRKSVNGRNSRRRKKLEALSRWTKLPGSFESSSR